MDPVCGRVRAYGARSRKEARDEPAAAEAMRRHVVVSGQRLTGDDG
jgi:hypothetical protein